MIRKHRAFISLVVFYMVLFLPFVGNVHLFDWDEINFAEAAREMLVTGDWFNVQIGYEPFWEKPPLFIWLQAVSMKIFGVGEFAARFPNVIIGLITLCVLYFTVRKRYGLQASIFTILLYIGSLTPHFYFKSGIIDPLYNLLMFLSILYLVVAIERKRNQSFLIAGLFLGAAILTKGPAALLIVGLSGLVYQIIYKINFYSFRSLVYLLIGLLVIPGIYFGAQIYTNGWWFVREFVVYQIDLIRYPIASHGQPFYYHFVVLLIGCFPLSIIAFKSLIKRPSTQSDQTFVRWMKIIFWVVLIVFSLVTTKIVHYSSMCYIPMAILGGVWMASKDVLGKVQKSLLMLFGVLWSGVFVIIGLLAVDELNLLHSLRNYIQDDFTLAQINTQVSWSITPIVLGGILLVFLVRAVFRYSKSNLASLLVVNTLVITIFMVSSVSNMETVLQGEWVNQLKKYRDKPVAHFTVGFKSYAHLYYTNAEPIAALEQVKSTLLKEEKLASSFYHLNQFEKKEFDNKVRDYVINHTTIPVSVSAKVNKFEAMESYTNLEQVFSGNGYGVWERKTKEE
jgi:hypothetical protein